MKISLKENYISNNKNKVQKDINYIPYVAAYY